MLYNWPEAASHYAQAESLFTQSGDQENALAARLGYIWATADSGVVSPGKSQLFDYDLPAGKYFIACFWPDYFNGMPHFLMGMWKLVTLS